MRTELIQQIDDQLDLYFQHPDPEGRLLSLTLPFTTLPFTTAPPGVEGIYWHRGSSTLRLLGLGCAWSHQSQGEHRFQHSGEAFEQLRNGWVQLDPQQSEVSPRLFFQYAFDEADPMEQHWQGLPNTELRLPTLLLVRQQQRQWITLSHPLTNQPPEQIKSCWSMQLNQLEWLLQQPPSPPVQFQHNNGATPNRETLTLAQSAIDTITTGQLQKVVLGECTPLPLPQPLQLQPVLQQMEQANPSGVQLHFSTGSKSWIAAPPEQLVKLTQDRVEADALAGTLPRGECEVEADRLETRLLQEEKLLHEHRLVADYIEQQLVRYCHQVEYPQQPSVHKLEYIQHLRTRLQGKLRKKTSLFQLVESLHQSPAICGTPKTESLAWLREHHNSQRGYYCGGAGWINSEGEGEIHVLLRCALIEPHQASLYAGAGIVAGSSAAEEAAEIALKREGILRLLTQPAPTTTTN